MYKHSVIILRRLHPNDSKSNAYGKSFITCCSKLPNSPIYFYTEKNTTYEWYIINLSGIITLGYSASFTYFNSWYPGWHRSQKQCDKNVFKPSMALCKLGNIIVETCLLSIFPCSPTTGNIVAETNLFPAKHKQYFKFRAGNKCFSQNVCHSCMRRNDFIAKILKRGFIAKTTF